MTSSMKSAKSFMNLSWKQRIIGFVICIIAAAILAILGCMLAKVSLPAFGVLFSLGTIAAVLSTFFLVSPIKQAKKFIDFSKKIEAIVRICAVVAVVLAVILVIVCGVQAQLQDKRELIVLAVFLAIIQFAALITYSITLIPFAMTVIIKGCSSLCAAA